MNVPKLRFKEFSGEWEEKKLENIGKIIGGGTPSSTIEEYWNGDIQWFTPTEVGKTKYIDKSVRTITELGLNKSSAKLLPKGTILLSSRATIGEKSIALKEVCTNQGFQSILVNKNNDNEFVYYLLDTLKEELIRQSSGSTFLEISGKKLGNVLSFIPKLEEQEKIGNFLSSIDKKISFTEEKLNLFNQYKKGIMQKIFSQKLRFKNKNGNDYPEWEEKKLNEVLKIGNGKDYKHLNIGKIPVYGTGGVITKVDDFLYNGESVGIGRKGTINKPIFLTGKFWTVDTLFYTYEFKNSLPKFIYYVFNNIDWLSYNEATGVPSLSKSTILKIVINLPCLEEQKKIADFLSSIDTKIEKISDELENLKEFKKGLLQKMFV